LYAYGLTPDLAEDDHVNLMRQGTIRLDLKFNAAFGTESHGYRMRGIRECDRNRNIVYGFTNW
jgi:hypothetical protein